MDAIRSCRLLVSSDVYAFIHGLVGAESNVLFFVLYVVLYMKLEPLLNLNDIVFQLLKKMIQAMKLLESLVDEPCLTCFIFAQYAFCYLSSVYLKKRTEIYQTTN